MKNSRTLPFKRQRGAVLVVSLIMLAVMTMFVISMLKTAVIELKIGGSSQVAALNLSNADTAIENFMALNSGRFAPNFLTSALPAAAPVVGSDSYSARDATGSVIGTVTLRAVQLSCGGLAKSSLGTIQYGSAALQAVQFDVAATAIGSTGYSGATVVHQGVQAVAGAGSCT